MHVVFFLCYNLFEIDLLWFLYMFKMYDDVILKNNMVENMI